MNTTQEFMQALQGAEATGDLSALLALHAPEVTLRNLTERQWQGLDGAEEFWRTYLGNFASIRSAFTHSHEHAGLGVMEWEASGQLKDGQDIRYRGVSLIELEGGKIKAFRTYYDSAAFVLPGASA